MLKGIPALIFDKFSKSGTFCVKATSGGDLWHRSTCTITSGQGDIRPRAQLGPRLAFQYMTRVQPAAASKIRYVYVPKGQVS